MGLFGGWRKKKSSKEAEAEGSSTNANANPNPNPNSSQQQQPSADTSVFEFGSAGEERLTIAGYCPVSNDLEPCRWEVMPAPPPPDNAAPLFRIVF